MFPASKSIGRLGDLAGQRGVLRQEVHLQNAQQHHYRTDQRVEEELDRRVETVLATPDANQEIHRHQRDFEEEVEEKKIHRSEDADHCRLQEKQQSVVFLLAFLDVVPG